jgi:hypothetical protein
MAAIVTDSLKKLLANLLYEDISNATDSDEYYVGIGKSDQYNAADTIVTPTRTIREERIARANLQSVKRVGDVSFVIPRYNWTSGTTYSGFNDNQVGIPTNTYYVLTEDNEVYICLQQGRNALGTAVPSTVKPSYTTAGVGQTNAFETADGYRWKFMYSISASRANSFLSANYVPIEKVLWETAGDSAGLNAFELQQLAVQRASKPGQITGISISSGGSGYTSAPTVTINGNGTGAAATATISGGTIVKIEMNNESAALGAGYQYADIEFSGGGGTGATARPIIGPINGIGADPRDDLKATSIMLNVKPDGTEDGAFIVGNDFRQISVFRNMEETGTNTVLTASDARALKSIVMATGVGSFSVDKLIRGGTSDAAAFIDDIDSDRIYFHQNENTGFGVFQSGETLSESDGSGTGTIDSASSTSLADAFSGELLYIENRARVIRDAAQQEDIKVIITI